MLALVRIALRRPLTFVVLAILILIVGPLAALRTPTDIFPDIRIPVISVVWQYAGLPPDEMAGRISSPFERLLGPSVNDIEHIEAQSLNGFGVIKIFFQPGVDISIANAQVTAAAQVALHFLPPGSTPPQILNYNASTVPIIQLALSGLPELVLADQGMNILRPILSTIAGTTIPYNYGGAPRQVMIDLDPAGLQARGLSAQDVANALAAQNQIIPVGTQKIGTYEYTLQLNNALSDIKKLGDLPIKAVNGTTIYMHDVAQVHDGGPPQTNLVHVNGKRSVLLTILKNGSASTLKIIAGIKQKAIEAKASLPDQLRIDPVGDQSLFVRAAISGVAREGIIAAALTSLMILLFLGSWRSTVIIATSIPLAILSSIVALAAVGETLNLMTLGGLALAVGILVDDATVTIENINWHLEQGKQVEAAILDGAAQIVTPAFVSLLCICIVFVPMFLLDGVARFLFVPMAEAVVFAMIASFILSRTLVPTMAKYLLKPHTTDEHLTPTLRPSLAVQFQRAFENRFEAIREGYQSLLERALNHRRPFVNCFMGFVVLSFALIPFLGRNFFPSVDSGQILLHARAPIGTRLETTGEIFAGIESTARKIIPPTELDSIIDNIGQSISGINTAYNNTGTVGPQDGDIQIALKKGHQPTADYVRKLREELPRAFPGVTFSFPPADIISQILNFGAPAPIDLQIRGMQLQANFAYADTLLRQIRRVPGVVDARIQQSQANPGFNIDVDRTRAELLGITESDVTNSLVVNLAGSSQVAPTFWLNPANGVSYPIVIQTPQYTLDSLAALKNLPISANASASGQILGGLATFKRANSNSVFSQYNIQPMVNIFATTQDRDLGAVAADIQRIVASHAKDLPKGSTTTLRGQVQTMNSAFAGMLFGLLGAIVLIYLLIVVNFQSWADPFVIIMALPAALAGIIWMLFMTHTTLSVPALTGAIMCMGVATANAILVVSFCRERLAEHGDAYQAALEGGFTRFRPVLMTALAMIIGMAPMALGLGEGGEQNAPLGRAVIGGLIFATAATLLLVPVIFSMIHARPGHASPSAPASGISLMSSASTPSGNRSRRGLLIGALVCAAIVVTGISIRAVDARHIKTWTDKQAVPTVKLVLSNQAPHGSILNLPGRLEAYISAPIFARVNGYVKSWYVDIGASVKAGQLLAEIEIPEIDQQLLNAQANLATAQANASLAETTALRWQAMLSSGAVAQQDVDQRTDDYTAKQALVAAAKANVDQLIATKGFARIVAPFDGVVTARKTDVGALINAGSGVGPELFTVSDVHQLRVYVQVPQNYAPLVRPGSHASLTVPEYPGQLFSAQVIASSGAVNAASGTTLIQLLVDNPGNKLMPGAFASLQIKLPLQVDAVRVPASALVFDAQGLRVATVDANTRVQFKTVTIAHDFGDTVEIGSGLSTSDRVIDTPPDGLANGDSVQLAHPEKVASHG